MARLDELQKTPRRWKNNKKMGKHFFFWRETLKAATTQQVST
jgi:hypothetical protein